MEYRKPIHQSSGQRNGSKKDTKATLQQRDRGSRLKIKEGLPIKQIGFDSTLSRREANREVPQMQEQYSRQGQIKLVKNLNN